MRMGIIILMIIALMVHALSFAIIYVSFKIHQDYIVANLCVQKDAPVNTCHGHCQLTDTMQDHDKKQKDHPLIQEGWLNFCFLEPINRFLFELILSQVREKKIFIPSLYSTSFIHKIFHPPK